LLVEDDRDACEIYSAFLSRAGFHVLIEHSAKGAFRAALAHRPDVIIADVRLPGGADGITLTIKLRLDVRTSRIPIIVVTGDVLLEDRARALAAGCDVFRPSPVCRTCWRNTRGRWRQRNVTAERPWRGGAARPSR
jgi:two-component system cell cycle response regulator DivK